MVCRLCGSDRLATFVDLGATPPCELFLTADDLDRPEPTYPLHARVCEACLLVQLPALIDPAEIFGEYAYFSSYSTSWVEHARRLVDVAVERADPQLVVEVASNDGYLLQHVLERGIRCLGIEPSANVGEAARERGVPTVTAFLDPALAAEVRAEHGPADVVVANNVYAHIPDVRGFGEALRTLAADDGWVVIEVQHLLTMIELGQFDTIYHEHFQYWTVGTARAALAEAGLRLVDVDLLPTHGGSIRLWARPDGTGADPTQAVADVLAGEAAAGLDTPAGYTGFAGRVSRIRNDLVRFLVEANEAGQRVAGYGAPGKGNTLLNYCGIRPDLLAYTVDMNPYKHGRFTPGTRIPIHEPEHLLADRPDVVLVLPWNLRDEIAAQLAPVREWGGRLVVAIPELEVITP
ncbi:class I SAM-dependent methyltransferase [Nocardioides marinquilinus]|uniref:Class I SAM-dependent methyltransferase n=1 Tax=Nocardioides marinquilinus TaxID=1210400 RepID=A0ABP9PDG0_9ACTN